MIQIYLPNSLNRLSPTVLQDVCTILFGTANYTLIEESRRTGRYIKVVNSVNGEVHFVCFSNPDNNSRNARLMQFVSPAYIEYYNDKSQNKHMDIYLIDQSANDRTDYIKMFYRCFATLGINILNLRDVGDISAFTTYEELSGYRKRTSLRNSHNRSTYFTDDDNQISIYGKTFGANAMESFIFGITINKIASKRVVFYPVTDNDSSSLSEQQTSILSENGIELGAVIQLRENREAKPSRDTSRNQNVFKYNLLQKYGDQQCYLCGCDVEHLIIASHIERVTDIDNNRDYGSDEKIERSADADNGLWLCASHDKMFEYGIVYFVEQNIAIRAFVNEKQRTFINRSIFEMRKVYFPEESSAATFSISPDHYTASMKNYLQKHLERHSIAT